MVTDVQSNDVEEDDLLDIKWLDRCSIKECTAVQCGEDHKGSYKHCVGMLAKLFTPKQL